MADSVSDQETTTVAEVAPEPTAVVNVCRHDDLVWMCPECKAEEQTA